MYKLLVPLILVLFFSFQLSAQETGKEKLVDKETYMLYLDKNWDNLIDKGLEALENGVDFYYLRMRIGMAYFYTGNYRSASKHFRKAVDIGYRNDIVDEFIYYSLLYSGQDSDAYLWGQKLSNEMQEKLEIGKKPLFNTFGISNTYSFNPESYDMSAFDIEASGWRNITKMYNLLSINAGNNLGKRVRINYMYSRLDKENLYFYKDESVSIDDKSRKVDQNQFYFSLRVIPSLGWELFAGYHHVNIKVRNKAYSIPDQSGGNGNGNNEGNNILVSSSVTSDNENLIFAGISKEFGKFNSGLAVYISDFNQNNQIQTDLTVNYYPLGNLNLYSTSLFSVYSDKGNIEDRSGVVFNQKIGFKVSRQLWLEVFTSLGDIKNFVVNRGTGIYNGTEIVKNNTGANIIIPFLKSDTKIFFSYSFNKNESVFTDLDVSRNINPISFNTHSITGGIQWSF